MQGQKAIIDNVLREIKEEIGDSIISSRIEVDDIDLYDLRLKPTNLPLNYYNPGDISLSWDRDTGFHMDIDGASWEFDSDYTDFRDTALRNIKAIFSGNAELKIVKLFGLIPLRHELTIKE